MELRFTVQEHSKYFQYLSHICDLSGEVDGEFACCIGILIYDAMLCIVDSMQTILVHIDI
jgi:hypothetical protein